MHLISRIVLLGAALLTAAPALAQQPAQQTAPAQAAQPQTAQPQTAPARTPSTQTAPAQTAPAMQPPGQAESPKAEPPKKPAAKSSNSSPRGTTRSMAFEVPPLVPIAEIPRGKAVTIQGVVLSPQATTFVLNDGNASQVITIGPTWRDLTKVKPGDRVRVIGQMDPYGTAVFRAGSILLENNRIVVVPAS
ncbi:MAG: hypothetical protein OJJ21_01140 [Ferrovibrio sp.]|uniref:hypothetical protein n=1 Tax=Ferrovibrio sp. TaxID=1917215 RepID=UPI00261E7C59|nr:hypothetical protein [Ferrovibrio sp.]MCW0232180.1 hypothetical protein [Ferrovibrio sp.]